MYEIPETTVSDYGIWSNTKNFMIFLYQRLPACGRQRALLPLLALPRWTCSAKWSFLKCQIEFVVPPWLIFAFQILQIASCESSSQRTGLRVSVSVAVWADAHVMRLLDQWKKQISLSRSARQVQSYSLQPACFSSKNLYVCQVICSINTVLYTDLKRNHFKCVFLLCEWPYFVRHSLSLSSSLSSLCYQTGNSAALKKSKNENTVAFNYVYASLWWLLCFM